MRFEESEHVDGWIGLITDDEDGHPVEDRGFKDIASAQDFIDKLQEALDDYKRKDRGKKK